MIRCRCSHRQCVDWDDYKFKRHFETKSHKDFEEQKEKGCVHQASINEMMQAKENQESDRLRAAGTRARISVDADTPFRKNFVKMMAMCGIPIVKANKMRRWVENECKKSLTDSRHLRMHIPDLLREETELQEKNLKAVNFCGIIFDATPRQGDLFAMLICYVELDEVKKRAICEQQLIHLSAVKGSLNNYTLAGEVSRGLQARGIKNEQAVCAMEDGCSTNWSAHKRMNSIADNVRICTRFMSPCLSHCASNAGKCLFVVVFISDHSLLFLLNSTLYAATITGDKASFVQLDHFWATLMKSFANLDMAKDIWFRVTGVRCTGDYIPILP